MKIGTNKFIKAALSEIKPKHKQIKSSTSLILIGLGLLCCFLCLITIIERQQNEFTDMLMPSLFVDLKQNEPCLKQIANDYCNQNNLGTASFCDCMAGFTCSKAKPDTRYNDDWWLNEKLIKFTPQQKETCKQQLKEKNN